MNRLSRKFIGLALTFGSVLCLYAAADSDWISKVPVKQQVQTNPMAQDSSSVEAGKRLYAENCASCHGSAAQGIGKHPSLVSAENSQCNRRRSRLAPAERESSQGHAVVVSIAGAATLADHCLPAQFEQ